MKILFFFNGIFTQPQRIKITPFGYRDVVCDFSAKLFINPEDPAGELVGVCTDRFGNSELKEIKIYEDEMFFTKEYLGENVEISYRLTKKSGCWEGKYSRHDTEGDARLLLTEVPDNFFDFPKK